MGGASARIPTWNSPIAEFHLLRKDLPCSAQQNPQPCFCFSPSSLKQAGHTAGKPLPVFLCSHGSLLCCLASLICWLRAQAMTQKPQTVPILDSTTDILTGPAGRGPAPLAKQWKMVLRPLGHLFVTVVRRGWSRICACDSAPLSPASAKRLHCQPEEHPAQPLPLCT